MDWCAAQEALRLLSAKWNLLVLAELENGPRRFNELLRATHLDGKQLTRTLHYLEGFGLVDRKAQTTPVRVHYRLTPRAHRLFMSLGALADCLSGAGRSANGQRDHQSGDLEGHPPDPARTTGMAVQDC
jgi:DNA-binding HxlR family transcriptional regulator